VDRWFDDAHADRIGCELHLLPQLTFIPKLGKQSAATRYPHGTVSAWPVNQGNGYMESLTETFPEHRKGAIGRCGQAQYAPHATKALTNLRTGAQMLKDFPELSGPSGKDRASGW
jgi:hypothetical protein